LEGVLRRILAPSTAALHTRRRYSLFEEERVEVGVKTHYCRSNLVERVEGGGGMGRRRRRGGVKEREEEGDISWQ
jgi:hypothetical protein